MFKNFAYNAIGPLPTPALHIVIYIRAISRTQIKQNNKNTITQKNCLKYEAMKDTYLTTYPVSLKEQVEWFRK